MTKGIMSQSCKAFLIKKIIGSEIYNKVNPETKAILLLDAIKQFSQEMEQKFGTFYNYQKDWCKRNGFEKPYGYYMELVKSHGFSGVYEYKNHMARKNGFKSQHEREKYWAKLRGETIQEAVKRNIKLRGFNSLKEYHDFLAKKAGFKNRAERGKYWKMKENVRKEVKRLLEESRENRKDIEIVKEVIVQNSKQLFIVIPKDLERLLHIRKGEKIKFIVKIPAKKTDKIQIKLEFENENLNDKKIR